MEKNILNQLETPVLILDNGENIIFENRIAMVKLGGGQSIVGKNIFDSVHCLKDVCAFDFAKKFEHTKELFDPTTGIYWRVHSKTFDDGDKKMVLIQFLDVNMQKIKARRLYSTYEFPEDVQEQIEDMFEQLLDAEFSRSSRSGNHFSLIMYSLDDIEGYIEKNGIEKTNLVLHDMGEIWAKNIRVYDYAPFYLKKNLFAVILPDVKKDMAEKIVGKIYRKIKEATNAALSIGIADSSDTPSSNNLATLVQRAVYVAQQRGGDSIALG